MYGKCLLNWIICCNKRRGRMRNWHTKQTPLMVVYSKKEVTNWKHTTHSNITSTTNYDTIYSPYCPHYPLLPRHQRMCTKSKSRYLWWTTIVEVVAITLATLFACGGNPIELRGKSIKLIILHTRNNSYEKFGTLKIIK